MTRGYNPEQIREKLIDALSQSKTGLTGIEIAEKLRVNRVTMAKYLKVFAAESLIKQKNIGSVNLWFIEKGVDQLSFPADLFQVKNRYLEYVLSAASQEVHNLVRTSLHSGANPSKLISEVIVSAIEAVENSYKNGKIGKSEKNFLDELITSSLYLIKLYEKEVDTKKNVVILSTDHKNSLLALAASAAFQTEKWRVSLLGDMSSAIDVMFDIDLQRFLNKAWPKREGIMIIVIFSSTEGETKFFSQAVDTSRAKFGKGLYLALCSEVIKKTKNTADFVSDDIEQLLQWSQTVFESSLN
ncbi:MAG TPA: ArsR family transcriptional regulator [Candidatus Nitrosotalea sp.]|nr:ArsR family transcriptional regulator [Nitrososphaerota archaeon]HKU32800.1 ArsR family transcriptional regulator [Candidatus Nitrosotalea sp.]